MADKKLTLFWRYSLFIGMAIGLLAKGPLALVLIGGSIAPWLLLHSSARTTFKAIPWTRGLLLTAILSVPWYIAAEIKTPGFLNYFIVGEHFLRFVDPEWAGDLYGSPHSRVHGTIWYYWIAASFPWGLIAITILLRTIFSSGRRPALSAALHTPEICFLLGWTLFTPVFFTLAKNILWTYLLPALAPFSILLAIALQKSMNSKDAIKIKTLWPASIAPITALLLTLAIAIQPNLVNTEEGLVHYAKNNIQSQGQLLFLNTKPFSARFYSRGTANRVTRNQIPQLLAKSTGFYLAVPKKLANDIRKDLPESTQKEYQSLRYVLFFIPPKLKLAAPENTLPKAIASTVVH